MLTHIVVWKYKVETDEATRHAHIEALRQLATAVPEVESLAVGADVLHLARSYDTGLVARFRDRAALARYDEHPSHKEVARMGRRISQHVASVDFESEDLATDRHR